MARELPRAGTQRNDMSNHLWIGAAVIIALVGCSSGPATSTLVGGGSLIKGPCQDPTADCPPTNGTGVYGAEGGDIGIDVFKALITHFAPTQLGNGQPGVTFQGRYWDAAQNRWEPFTEPGVVSDAEYVGKKYRVVSVGETDTEPTWTLQLQNPANSPMLPVTRPDLPKLALHIVFQVNGARQFYKLTFNAPSDVSGAHLVHTYRMHWTRETPTTARGSTPSEGDYCHDANKQVESVVFQQTIAVDPDTGKVTHDPSTQNLVTLSCISGGIAKVYNKYGYRYRGPDTNADHDYYFAAAIQMKRASYCADAHHYTIAGTEILIGDDKPINQQLGNQPPSNLEASWTPDGAKCVNMDHLRHPELKFLGSCLGQQLPACTAQGKLADMRAP